MTCQVLVKAWFSIVHLICFRVSSSESVFASLSSQHSNFWCCRTSISISTPIYCHIQCVSCPRHHKEFLCICRSRSPSHMRPSHPTRPLWFTMDSPQWSEASRPGLWTSWKDKHTTGSWCLLRCIVAWPAVWTTWFTGCLWKPCLAGSSQDGLTQMLLLTSQSPLTMSQSLQVKSRKTPKIPQTCL